MSVRHDQLRHFFSEHQYFGQKIELAQQGLRRGSDYVGYELARQPGPTPVLS